MPPSHSTDAHVSGVTSLGFADTIGAVQFVVWFLRSLGATREAGGAGPFGDAAGTVAGFTTKLADFGEAREVLRNDDMTTVGTPPVALQFSRTH